MSLSIPGAMLHTKVLLSHILLHILLTIVTAAGHEGFVFGILWFLPFAKVIILQLTFSDLLKYS